MNTPEAKPEVKMWAVIDRNATKGPRTHEVPTKYLDGEVLTTKQYQLNSETATPMLAEHAMFFLKDSAFVVFNAAGEEVTPVPVREGGTGGFVMGEDEVIATYGELSKEALFKRCKIIAGSEHINETRTKKEDMIAFLKERAKPPVGVSRGSEGLEENARLADEMVAKSGA